jgi:hypothetical protein
MLLTLNRAGNMYMSTIDMSKHLWHTLNHTQISSTTLRRWLKPVTFLPDLRAGVGAPWEITRMSGWSKLHNIDLYRKEGEIGYYSSLYALVPDFHLGYALNMASVNEIIPRDIESMILDTLIPAAYAISKEQAAKNFAGTYTARGINSTIVLAVDDEIGILVQTFVSNGIDILGNTPKKLPRAYPMNLVLPSKNNTSRTAFRVVLQAPISGVCISWMLADYGRYAGRPLDELVFETGPDGVATKLYQPGLKITMEKKYSAAPTRQSSVQ